MKQVYNIFEVIHNNVVVNINLFLYTNICKILEKVIICSSLSYYGTYTNYNNTFIQFYTELEYNL